MKRFYGLAMMLAMVATAAFGITADEKYLLNNKMGSVANKVQLGTLIDDATTVVSADITDGTIVNADVSTTAAIAYSKLAALTDGNILVGNGSNVAVSVNPSGDVDISNAGVFSIASGAVVNADVSGSAAIDFSKLATLASGNLLVGSAGGVATSVAMSGDATIAATGAVTIASNAIGSAEVTDNTLAVADLSRATMAEASGTLTQANLVAISTPIELIAAAGAGTVIVVDEIVLFHDYAVAAYNAGSDVAFEYETSGDNIALVLDTFVTDGADAYAVIKPSTYDLDGSTGTGAGFVVTSNVNKGVFVTATNFGAGDATNIVKWVIRYHVVTLPT